LDKHSHARAPHTATEMMEIEKYIRSPARAVGLKPSARQGKARLRGLERIMYSKTIISVYRRSNPTSSVVGRDAVRAGSSPP
jgi:hypothetical protein